ncbi:MAG: helix-turn-helix domain-containing protein [Psychrosphaera sp.]|nr:helix-turn-helix domain-containing protein [Psychrosphaera sp.]
MSDVIKSLRSDLEALCGEGLVNKITLREFDERNMTKLKEINSEQIKQLRADNHISQGVLAKYLNMSPVSIQKWERGESKPTGAALKLLNVINNHGLSIVM